VSHVGDGPLAVYGASMYSPGQEIYKSLRQEESLMAFLACQGEPDRLEVLENAGGEPRVILEYTRSGIARRGTVEILPTAAGYYAAQPIDPNGSLKAPAKNPSKRGESGARPKPAAKQKAPPPQKAAPPPKPEPEPEEPAAAPPPPAPTPSGPKPSATQLDECPIEPWRADCKQLCSPGASWEWCSYEK
jgi:hypothetical protein